ncbi:deoxyribose operon repressor domain protein [Enterobacter hormaechei subsp. xiangfangensis]|nr:deoxyribose operon repressor domain protein [Enterobacter hormaechei subsp. xiangfangensis]
MKQGATCFNLEELPVKQWALNAAQQHVLVVDHSKFGKAAGKDGELSLIVSDCRPDASWSRKRSR